MKSVKIIENNLQRLDVLIKRVLDGSRTLTGNLEFDVREFDLAAALTELHDTYNPLAEEKGLNCSFEGPNKLMMKSDKLRIQQIVSNAMDNALKYTPSGGQVNCTFSYTPEQAIIQITDSGDGISEEMMNQLFRPFSRVHGTETSQPGSGLGLFLSKEIAEALGGSMSASSKGRGKGTKIIVELPLIAKNRQKANEA